MSLQYWPHEDLHVKSAAGPGVHSGGLEPGAGDYFAIAVINLTLAMALVSFALNDGVIGALVVFGPDRRVQRAGAARYDFEPAQPSG